MVPSLLEVDYVFEALARPRRRYLLYTLLETSDRSLEELAVEVAAWERDVPTDDVSDEARERTYVSLYHTHVPKLVDEDIVSFDEASGMIAAGPNAELVLTVLSNVDGSTESELEGHAREDGTGGFV